MLLALGREIRRYRIPHGRVTSPVRQFGACRRLVPSRAELRGALAGAIAIGLRLRRRPRFGLTRADIARTLAPGNPVAGRAAQLALGTLASLPGRARAARPRGRSRAGAALGALASREGRAFSAAAHALAAVVAQRVARVRLAEARSGARARRASVSSRPSRWTLSNRPGEMLVPVIATRTSPKTTRGLSASSSQTPRSAASIARPSTRSPRAPPARPPGSRRRARARRPCPRPPASISTGPNRNEQSGSNSASVAIFSCASGVTSTIRSGCAASGEPRSRRNAVRRSARSNDRQRAQVDAVHPLELLGVEDGRRRVDALEREQADQLGEREQLALGVEMPAHQREEVDDRLGEVAGLAQLLDARRAVALREPLPVGAEEQRQMRERRHRRARAPGRRAPGAASS